MTARFTIFRYLRNKVRAITAPKIAKATGINSNTVRKVLGQLKTQRIVRSEFIERHGRLGYLIA